MECKTDPFALKSAWDVTIVEIPNVSVPIRPVRGAYETDKTDFSDEAVVV